MPKLVSESMCVGCTACACVCPKNAIVMNADTEGFLHPFVNSDACVGCGACERACPRLCLVGGAATTFQAYAAYTNDDEVRMSSSSGGIFTEIAKLILSEGGIVFGAAYNDQFDVVHIAVETEQDLMRLRGAKYAQSALGDTYSKVKINLENSRKVAFVGTPCQVAGLYSFLGKPYDNLILIDLICHGAPSPTVWQVYRNEQKNMYAGGSDIVSLNMRDKRSGWSRYQYSFCTQYANGIEHTVMQGQDAFLRGFAQNIYLRPSCENCQFKGEQRYSDITLGDYWGVWDHYPEFDDNKGVSLVILHSSKGTAIWSGVQSKIQELSITKEQAYEQNPSALSGSLPHAKREVFFKEFSKQYSFSKAIKKVNKEPFSFRRLFRR